MRAVLILAALAAPLAAPSAQAGRAELEAFLEICADPQRSAFEHRQACFAALEEGERTGLLDAPGQARVWVNYGVAAVELNDLNDALMAYTRAIVSDPTLLQAYLNRAAVNVTRGRDDQALADYQAVIARDPENMDALIGRGVILLRQGETELAMMDLDQAALLHPMEPEPFFTRGIARLNLGQAVEAEQDFSRVIRLDPQDVEAIVNRGRARAAQGLPNAAEDFDAAIALRPEWSAAWMARGRYLDGLGQREDANRDFKRAYELGHQDPWLVERMREISG